MGTHEGWNKARPIGQYYQERKARGEKLSDAIEALSFVDLRQAAYGDWRLYVDEDGNYWEDYESIGD